MSRIPISSVEDAIERGRSGRGRGGVAEWVRVRAQVLSEVAHGLSRARIGGILGVSSQRVTQLTEEACDAVLRGGAVVRMTEEVCAATWTRWCVTRGDDVACSRLRGEAPNVESAPGSASRRQHTKPAARALDVG